MFRHLVLPFLFFVLFSSKGQKRYVTDPRVDVQHYTFELSINDRTNEITGKTEIRVRVAKGLKELVLDLQNKNGSGRGMEVGTVKNENGSELEFTHEKDRLHIVFSEPVRKSGIRSFEIEYSGTPVDGLVIGKNMYGERTFFGDNYPDRARCWLPCVDHPSDKATLEWIVEAPSHYRVIGNGTFAGRKLLNDTVVLTQWKEDVPISTKIMVIAAAGFAVDTAGMFKKNIPVESWVYPQNREKGLKAFSIALPVIAFYDSLFGSYPYEKLANVQSTTRYGGCENASNIFYAERSVFADTFRTETLVAHEIVHQWFGNSVTECDWSEAWLSEGFATYFTHVYVEKRYGRDIMLRRLKQDRERVISYLHQRSLPVVDTLLVTFPVVGDVWRLLSTNTYQKGSWFLHMLRCNLGDDDFFKGLRRYYHKFRNQTASTTDLKKVMEDVSGKDLDVFFRQWLYQPELPVMRGSWSYSFENGLLTVSVEQTQNYIFDITVEIGIRSETGFVKRQVLLTGRKKSFTFTVQDKPYEVVFDPETSLLFEGSEIITEE